jgi:mRNA interferase YafQ
VSAKPRNAGQTKRAHPPCSIDYAKPFLKDWVRLTHSGRYDMTRLVEVMGLLMMNQAPLGAEWKDHALSGEWNGYRECHVGGDFLLIYARDNEQSPNAIVFTRIGTHADLFE